MPSTERRIYLASMLAAAAVLVTTSLPSLAQAPASAVPPSGTPPSGTPPSGMPATPGLVQQVEIVGTSPLPGQGVDRNLLPYATQVLRRGQADAAQAEHLTDLLQRRMAGVQVNDIQGSPLQGDLTYRGFRASGLIGAAQGLSVYLDGVRINEPFGDVVNWDLVPMFALDAVTLVSGANPAFGLNTLGGALALTTGTGRSATGWRGEVQVGSFGRRRLELSHGVTHSGLELLAGVSAFSERGWRDHSPGRALSGLLKLGVDLGGGTLTTSLLAGRSTLTGNGLVPLDAVDDDGQRTPDLGARRRTAVYTHPDRTRNELAQASVGWRRAFGASTTLETLAYVRHTRRHTVNGDEAEEHDDDVEEEASALGLSGLTSPRSGGPRPQRLRPLDSHDEPNAAYNRTATRQRGFGLSLALSGVAGSHQWQIGLALDAARVHYRQSEQEARFDPSRGVLPIPGEEEELSAEVAGRSRLIGLYATDTWRLAPRTHVTAAVRLNHARVENTLTTRDDDSDVLESHPRERFSYRNLNPALGLVHGLGNGVAVFANAARNTRVPTVIELGCADPEEPCRLPAGLQADPYLKPVRASTVEAGARLGTGGRGHSASLALYRTDNRDDILFRSVSVNGQLGYFQNFARTRHEGADLQWQWQAAEWELGAGYSHLNATYQADGVLRMGERNVLVRPGTRIAGLPRHGLKLHVLRRLGANWTLGADLQAYSRRSTAGNEDGLIENDEDETVDLSLPGYALVNLHASWKPAAWPGIELALRVQNLFDRRSASFGALAETRFDSNGNYTGAERGALFVAPGAPRSLQMVVRMRF